MYWKRNVIYDIIITSRILTKNSKHNCSMLKVRKMGSLLDNRETTLIAFFTYFNTLLPKNRQIITHQLSKKNEKNKCGEKVTYELIVHFSLNRFSLLFIIQKKLLTAFYLFSWQERNTCWKRNGIDWLVSMKLIDHIKSHLQVSDRSGKGHYFSIYEKAFSAIPMRLKYDTWYSCYW